MNIEVVNFLFEGFKFDLYFNRSILVEKFEIPKTNKRFSIQLDNVDFLEGDNILQIVPNKKFEPTNNERRELSLMFVDLLFS